MLHFVIWEKLTQIYIVDFDVVIIDPIAGINVPHRPYVTSAVRQPRRNSLRFAPFGPPTVSCVLAAARTCIRQAPPTSRGRGPATSASTGRLPGCTFVNCQLTVWLWLNSL